MSTLALQLEIGGGLFGLIWLILTIYVLIKILTSTASGMNKLLWIIVILLLPILGPILWLLLGNKS